MLAILKGREWKALSDYYTKRLSELIKTGADPNTALCNSNEDHLTNSTNKGTCKVWI